MKLLIAIFLALAGTTQAIAQGPTVSYSKVPILKREAENPIIRITIPAKEGDRLENFRIALNGAYQTIKSLKVYYTKNTATFHDSVPVATVKPTTSEITIRTNTVLPEGTSNFWISAELTEKAKLLDCITVEVKEICLNGMGVLKPENVKPQPFRLGLAIRKRGEDNVHTYRIPGLATTNKGTLIAVYDNRYHGSGDLQGDIDVGMSRSTDGGETWEPMKVIMDMGEFGGLPQNQNGVGDPAVLVDKTNNTIWVAAVWAHGFPNKANWWASKPGMSPNETSQLMLVKSTDDGLSWSKPINITQQVKDSAWQLLLQGPGSGITMKNGTLVFAAQFKQDIGTKAIDGGKYTCHSTILYSTDHGETWKIGTGAKSNTTEAQVVELSNGTLMLNMRDDRNRKDKGESNGRAVAITTDMGKSWSTHPSSNGLLPEPNCMASLLRVDYKVKGRMQPLLFFSNPRNKSERSDMTIQASLDEGSTWSAKNSILYNSTNCYGYSCLTQVDANTIGVLYEGAGELFFQKFKIEDILNGK